MLVTDGDGEQAGNKNRSNAAGGGDPAPLVTQPWQALAYAWHGLWPGTDSE